MDISIIVLLHNAESSLSRLSGEIHHVCKQNGISYEILFMDNGSRDRSWAQIKTLRFENPDIKGIRFHNLHGKGAALNEGFKSSSGEVVVTMEAGSGSTDEIPELRRMILDYGFDLVEGRTKKASVGPLGKGNPLRFNRSALKTDRIQHTLDGNFGINAYRREVVKNVEVQEHMHHYITALAKWKGFDRVGKKMIGQGDVDNGTIRCDPGLSFNRSLDMASIVFVGRYGKKPMQFFGLMGSTCFLIGSGTCIYVVVAKLLEPNFSITNMPAFFIALAMAILGMQLFLVGFIAELLVRNSPDRNDYGIEEKLGI